MTKINSSRCARLAMALALALAACSGSQGPAGQDGVNGTNGTNGTNGVDGVNGVNGVNGTNGADGSNGGNPATTGLHAVLSNPVVSSADNTVSVDLALTDDRGLPVDVQGVYSVNWPMTLRLGLGFVDTDSSGRVMPYTVLTKSGGAPTMLTASNTTLTEVGSGKGTYTFKFPASAAVDPTLLTKTYTVWLDVARQTDMDNQLAGATNTVVNTSIDFIPGGNGTPLKRELVLTENCNKCHAGFKPENLISDLFHGGHRIDGRMCNMCHNPARTSNPAADSAVFIHRIHNSEELQPANIFDGVEGVTYPQDIRNCAECHGGAAQGGQAQTTITMKACGSCHDYVDFSGAPGTPVCSTPLIARDANGVPVPCAHVGGQQTDDTGCAACHKDQLSVANSHMPVIPPDPNNTLNGGTNSRTNAAYVAGAGVVPPGASVISYKINSVSRDSNKHGVIVFKFQKDGADVVFNTYQAGVKTELMDNFVGTPSVYFAFAVPQDGVNAPSDFNATISGNIKQIWNGTSATSSSTSHGTISGPDGSGWYTIILDGLTIPDSAVMLTGGVGYTYSLPATMPLTQTNVPLYPYTAATKQGGLIVPAQDAWKVADNYTGRRKIVDTAKCNTCHSALGVSPNFHVGQRNDGPTCSFCHTPNQTSSGWSAGSKVFIHGIHAGNLRATPFTWHASSPTDTFADVEFPSRRNNCEACHVAGMYDYSSAPIAVVHGDPSPSPVYTDDVLAGMLYTTVGSGSYASTSTSAYQFSPYVTLDNDYGAGPSYSAGTGTITAGAGTTLVTSPVMTVCSSCHDKPADLAHMRANGGSFYAPRSTALTTVEQCLICHGPAANSIAPIAEMHK